MAAPNPPSVTIHEALLESGPTGAVQWGRELTFEEAVQRRGSGDDVVVRGDDHAQARRTARRIEAAIGIASQHEPHARAGKAALPHFQQAADSPRGHTFYETTRRKARVAR